MADEILRLQLRTKGVICTSDIKNIKDYNFYVVAVSISVNAVSNPSLTPLVVGLTTEGKVIYKGEVV